MTPQDPDAAYIDTSVVIAAIYRDLTHARPSTAFCAGLVAAGSRVVYSEILWLELSQVIARLPNDRQLPEEVRQQYELAEWERRLDVRSRWMRDGLRAFDFWLGQFASTTKVRFDRDVWEASVEVMARYRLRSHDAIHVATARRAGVRVFATLDDDFRRVPDLDVRLLRDPLV